MRKLILVLVALIAVVTFIRAYEGYQAELGASGSPVPTVEESVPDN